MACPVGCSSEEGTHEMSDTELDGFPQTRFTDEETVRNSLHKSWDKDVHGPAWPRLCCVRSIECYLRGNPKECLSRVKGDVFRCFRGIPGCCLNQTLWKTSSLSRCVLSFVIVSGALPFTQVKVCAETPFLNVRGSDARSSERTVRSHNDQAGGLK